MPSERSCHLWLSAGPDGSQSSSYRSVKAELPHTAPGQVTASSGWNCLATVVDRSTSTQNLAAVAKSLVPTLPTISTLQAPSVGSRAVGLVEGLQNVVYDLLSTSDLEMPSGCRTRSWWCCAHACGDRVVGFLHAIDWHVLLCRMSLVLLLGQVPSLSPSFCHSAV